MDPTVDVGPVSTSPPPGPSGASGHATVLGDIIRSREMSAEPGWDRRVTDALGHVRLRVEALQPPTPTVGDEFQAVYPTLGAALRATFLCRLFLEEAGMDSRYGVGWGRILTWRRGHEPFRQDGPAWWLAREAIDRLAEQQKGTRRPPQLRTMVRVANPATEREAARSAPADGPRREPVFSDPPLPGMGAPVPLGRRLDASLEPLLQAVLYARDTVAAGWDERDRRLYLALDAGETVTSAAEALEISVPTASGRLQRNGIYALLELDRLLLDSFEAAGSGGRGRS